MTSANPTFRPSNPFFSIITISFNQCDYLYQCISSIRHQSFQSFEHIVVDPGSTDDSRSLILSHSDKLRYIFKADSGPADGLNNGFDAALGTYALFINADDYLLSGALENAFRLLRFYSWPDLLFLGGIKVFSGSDSIQRVFPGSISSLIQAVGLSHFYQQGAILKISAFKKTNMFNPNNSTCWDADLFLQILSNPQMRVCRHPISIAAFRIHPSSISGSQKLQSLYFDECNKIINSLYPLYVIQLRKLVSMQPIILARILKYALDPKLAYWLACSLFMSRN